MSTLRISYSDEHERTRKLLAIVERLGYVVTAAPAERITVGELAGRVQRPLSTVSRALRRASCPDFVGKQGMKRIVWIEPNAKLLAFLGENRKGKRRWNDD